jgi:uncharacterized RmlC-like cupin family protein
VVPLRILITLALAFCLHAQRKTPIENQYVRVLDVTDSSNTKGRSHEHAMNRVMIYLTRGKQKLEYADGRTINLEFEPGTALWSPAGGMHTSQNVGGAPFRVIEVELKNTPGTTAFGALDPVRVDPRHYKVTHDYPQARVIRVKVDGRQQIPLHEHVPNRVIVFVSDTRTRAIDEAGNAIDTNVKAGEVRWAGAAKHREENLSDQPFDVVVVELK